MQTAGQTEYQNSTKTTTLSNVDLLPIFHRIFLLIGLRKVQYPTPEEDVFNSNFIKKNYGHKTTNEIIEAFELAVTGKLDVDVKHYDQFTLPYFCKIMDAYRIFNNERILATPPPKLKLVYDTSCVCAGICANVNVVFPTVPATACDAKAVVNATEPPLLALPDTTRSALLSCVVDLVQPVGAAVCTNIIAVPVGR
jgi:hypothetical protein